jgi:hypothetical protein
VLKYFLVFQVFSNDVAVLNNSEMLTQKSIKSLEDVEEIEKMLKRKVLQQHPDRSDASITLISWRLFDEPRNLHFSNIPDPTYFSTYTG